MQIITVTQNPSSASTTNIAASQAVAGAGALTLTALAAAIDTSVGGRIIGITSAADDHTITFTVTGLDQNGLATSEIITGASGAPGTSVSTKFYSSISSIVASGAAGVILSVGTVGTTLSAESKLTILNYYTRTATQVAVEVTGTINYTVKETFAPVLTGSPTTSSALTFTPTNWSAGKTANAFGLLDIGATGVVFIINSYSTGATLTARIITPSNSNLG